MKFLIILVTLMTTAFSGLAVASDCSNLQGRFEEMGLRLQIEVTGQAAKITFSMADISSGSVFSSNSATYILDGASHVGVHEEQTYTAQCTDAGLLIHENNGTWANDILYKRENSVELSSQYSITGDPYQFPKHYFRLIN